MEAQILLSLQIVTMFAMLFLSDELFPRSSLSHALIRIGR